MNDERFATDSVPGGDVEPALDPMLAAAIAELPAEIAPGRDLWPEIAATVARRRQGRQHRQRRALLALAASLLVGVVSLLVLAAMRSRTERLEARGPEKLAAPATVPAALTRTVYSESEATLDGVRRTLEAEIEARQDRLPPETRALVFENLRTIDRALAEIEAALAASPGDAELARTAMTYRQRQIDLLRQANRVASRL